MGKPQDKITILIIATLGTFQVAFMMAALNVALPRIGSDLAMDAISLGWVATGYYLTAVVFNVPFGRVGDIYGRKKVYTWGMIVFTIASFVLAMSNSDSMLIGLRFVQGAGGGVIFSISVALMTSVFTGGERSRALGLYISAVSLGTSLGPFLGGLLTQYFGWRSIFMANVPVGLFILILILWRLKGDWIEAAGESIDIVGSVLYAVMLVAIVYGFTHLPGVFGAWLIAIGFAGFAAFVIWETRVHNPIVNIDLFSKNRGFAFACLATLIHFGASYAVAFLVSLYLQYIKGFSPQDAGLVLVSQPAVQAVVSPFVGRISNRIQPRIVASAGMALTVISLLVFIFLTEEMALPVILTGFVLLGIGSALFLSPNTDAAMTSVERKFYGVASASQATMRQFGMIVSMGIVMLLFSLYMGKTQVTPEYYGAFVQSITVSFIISTILCIFGVFVSLARGQISGINSHNS